MATTATTEASETKQATEAVAPDPDRLPTSVSDITAGIDEVVSSQRQEEASHSAGKKSEVASPKTVTATDSQVPRPVRTKQDDSADIEPASATAEAETATSSAMESIPERRESLIDPLQLLAGCAVDLPPLPPAAATVDITVVSPVVDAVSAIPASPVTTETAGGLYLLCEAACLQRPTPGDQLATLLAAAQLLSTSSSFTLATASAPVPATAESDSCSGLAGSGDRLAGSSGGLADSSGGLAGSDGGLAGLGGGSAGSDGSLAGSFSGRLAALCEVAGQQLARAAERRVFFVPPRWEMWRRPTVDPAGRREYRTRQSAELAREWLRRRAAGNGAGADQLQVQFTIEPFWEDSPRIRELRSKLADIRRLYQTQLKLHRLSPRKTSSECPAKRRPSCRGARRPVARRRSDATRTPPRAPSPPARTPAVEASDSDSEEGGRCLDVWEDTACADDVSYSFSSRREDNYTNGIRALAECKKRQVPQTADRDLTSDPARKKRKLCPPKKHSFSPDDTETIVAKKKCFPLLKPKLKPKLKAEVILKDSFSDGEEPPPPPPPLPPPPVVRKASGSKESSSKPRSVSREAGTPKRRVDSREAGAATAKRRKSGSDVHTEKHKETPHGKVELPVVPAGNSGGAVVAKPAPSERVISSPAPAITVAPAAPVAPPAASPSQSTSPVNGHSSPAGRDPALTAGDLSAATQLLVLIDGLFYRSRLEPIQPPDLYGVTVEGERCHRPNIYTQEELLNQAVREVRPVSFSSLTPGTRVLANWSPKLRGLFPGTVTEGASPEPGMLYVEFDDGDSGYMRLEGIRMLPPDYPTVEHDQDPLDTLSRRRRRASSGASATSSQRAASRQSVGDERWEPPSAVPAPAAASAETPRLPAGDPRSGQGESKMDKQGRPRTEESKRVTSTEGGKKSDGSKGKKGEEGRKKAIGSSSKAKGSESVRNDSQKRGEDAKAKKTMQTKDRKTDPSKKKKPEQSKKAEHAQNGVDALQNGGKPHENPKGDEAQPPKKKKKKKDSADTATAHTTEERTEKKKKKAKRRESAASEGYVVEQESALKLRIKSPSPSRKQEKDDATTRERQHSADGKKKKKSEAARQRHPSGMAAFLPERQLWDWEGKGVKRSASKGKAKREVFKAIVRGAERIGVGDCAVFLSAGLPDRPYVGKIQALWETTSGQMLVQVAWFYHPEETCGLDRPLAEAKGGLFESPHMDDNDVQTISHRCQVLSLAEYRLTVGGGDNETFYRAGFYDPRCQVITREPGV